MLAPTASWSACRCYISYHKATLSHGILHEIKILHESSGPGRAVSVLGLTHLCNIPHEGEVLVLYFRAHPPVHEEMNGFLGLYEGVSYFTKCHTTSTVLVWHPVSRFLMVMEQLAHNYLSLIVPVAQGYIFETGDGEE